MRNFTLYRTLTRLKIRLWFVVEAPDPKRFGEMVSLKGSLLREMWTLLHEPVYGRTCLENEQECPVSLHMTLHLLLNLEYNPERVSLDAETIQR